jgi:putative peptidoglycan lipid II flippase
MTSLSLVAFAFGLPGMIGAKILITNYYSRKNTGYPVKAAVISVIANFVMNLTFVYYLTSSDFKGAHVGLALATSLSAYINFILLFANAIKTKILEIDKSIIIIMFKTVLSSIAMMLFILYFDLNMHTWINLDLLERILRLAMIISLATLVYFTLLYLLKISPKKIKKAEL